MQSEVENMQNYFDYIKCGEILKSPLDFRCPYVLKCSQCDGTYMLLESFIFHIEDSCKSSIASIKHCPKEVESLNDVLYNNNTTKEADVYCEGEGRLENVTVKVENNNTMESEDPLIVKPDINSDDEFLSVIEESKLLTDQVMVNDIYDEDITSELTDKTSKSGLDDINEIQEEVDENTSDSVSEELDCESDEDDWDKKNAKAQKHTPRSSDFVANFMKSHTNVAALITAYKNQPCLWNKNFPSIRHKVKRQDFLQHIVEELKDAHNLDVTYKQVASVIVYLCRTYREDLKSIKGSEEQNYKFKPSWYFNDLNFLKPFMENNLIAKLESHMPDLLPDQIIQILEIYKGFCHLWNTHLIEYYCKNKRNDAKNEMLRALEAKVNIKISEHTLVEYLRTVHTCFSRTKKNKLIKKPETEETKHDYYEYMMFLYDHVGAFKCSVCDREFKSPLNLKIHKSQHIGCEPLKCSLCQKEFKSSNSYTNHAKRHMEDYNHECKECGKKFLHRTDLKIHMRNHTGAKPFCCEICGSSFRHIQGFTSHRRRHEKNYLHTCHICSKGYYSKDRYIDHMNAHENIRSQICNVCGKAFITKRSLQQHVVIHEDVRRHACKLCGKTFKHKTGVNQHMRSHGIANKEEKTTVNSKQLQKIS